MALKAISFAVPYTLPRLVYRALPEVFTRPCGISLERYLNQIGRFGDFKNCRRAVCLGGTTMRSGGIATTDR